ncbi:MAG TPA: hypothetical protein VHO69_14680, partial [Phototrophicaceae bacterium]|nr:hypothetical protein [Phototrophicaceae bacterium]
TLNALCEMIIRPAEQSGLEFEYGLPDRILQDTGIEPGALALMAYALDELYRSGTDNKRLGHDQYDDLGGVQGAIGKRAETVFCTLDLEAQNSLPTVFQEIVEVDERGEPTRRRAELKAVASDPAAKRLVDALTGERARLIVQDKDGQGCPIVEVAHEALLRQWPRLRDWIGTQQSNLRMRRQIQQAMKEWVERDRNPAYLLGGGRLADAQAWIKQFSAGDLEREYVLTSIEQEQARQAQERTLALKATESAEKVHRAIIWLRFTFVFPVFIIFYSIISILVIRSSWIETVDATLWETTEQVIANSRAYKVRGDGSVSNIAIALPELDVFRASGVGVQVWSNMDSAEPTLAGISTNLSNYRQPLDPDTLGTFASRYTTVQNNDMELRILTRTVTLPNKTRPLWNVQAGASLETINEAIIKLTNISIFLFFTTLFIVIVIALVINRGLHRFL